VSSYRARIDVTTIRHYRESDAEKVGRLIAETYSRFNLDFLPTEDRVQFLGPFRYANSKDPSHREEIAQVIEAAMVFVAENEGEIIGVLRGRHDKLQSLFVRGDSHRQGVGRRLVERFEQACLAAGSRTIKVQSTLYAVPFYTAMGYKKTTGVRRMKSFEGEGLAYQPMKKLLDTSSGGGTVPKAGAITPIWRTSWAP
jgi:GNAT superfamily N-acetyltransferase